MEYTLRSGKVVTDEQIEAMAEAIEAGSLPDRIAAIAADPVPLGTNDASPICEARSN